MPPQYKIAVIQLHPKPLDPPHNFFRSKEFIQAAAAQGAHLAVLPEYHLTNWVPHDPQFFSFCKGWKHYLYQYKELAKNLRICIVPGTIVEAHQDGETGEEHLHNVAYYINDKGEVVGRYQKKNLWHPERPHLTSSTHAPHELIQTPLGPAGLLICWDLAFPEAFRELIAKGAKIIIIPTFWTHADCSDYGLSKNSMCEKLFLESTLTARAFENTCAVVFVNAGAPPSSNDEMSPYAGLSRVTMPFVGPLGDETKDTSAEGMSVVDVDMEMVEEAERHYRVRADMEGEGWHYTYRHHAQEGWGGGGVE